MVSLSFYDIYPQTIENATGTCESALEQAGCTKSEIDDVYLTSKKQAFDSLTAEGNITNCIIDSMFQVTKEVLEEKGYQVDYYVNGDDSHLYIDGEEYYEGDELPKPAIAIDELMSEEELSSEIEQFMYERGEYDYDESDRIQWLNGLPNAFDVAGSYDVYTEARQTVTENIQKSLQTEDGKQNIINYLNGELQVMDKYDESRQIADWLIRELELVEVSADYTQIFIDMVEAMNFTVHKDENGYYFVDERGENLGDIESDRFKNAVSMIGRLDVYLNESYFNDLEEAAEEDFAYGAELALSDNAPVTAEDWVKFMDKHEDFKEHYKHEYDVMNMLAHPDEVKSINLDDVVTHFAPEEVKQVEAYEKYKDAWIKEHISDEEMTATEAAYENDEEAKDMTFDEYVQEFGFANGEVYASFDEFLHNEYEEFLENEDYSLDMDEIRALDAGESVTIDDFMDGIDAVVTKDSDYDKSRDYMDMVTVDFKADGKSIASTYDIHVDDLEDALNEIRDGATDYLVDSKNQSLQQIANDYMQKTDKAVERE